MVEWRLYERTVEGAWNAIDDLRYRVERLIVQREEAERGLTRRDRQWALAVSCVVGVISLISLVANLTNGFHG